MRIISRRRLREFWELHPDARSSLQSWFADVKNADWEKPGDIKNIYSSASLLAHNRIVFNIKGNKYRIIILVQYSLKIVYIRFVGTHKEYDTIDANSI